MHLLLSLVCFGSLTVGFVVIGSYGCNPANDASTIQRRWWWCVCYVVCNRATSSDQGTVVATKRSPTCPSTAWIC